MAGSITELSRYRYNRALEEMENARLSFSEGRWIIREASEMREHADYEDFFIASKQESKEQMDKADTFIAFVKQYLEDRAII